MRLLTTLAAERGGLIPTFRLRQSGLSPRRIAALCHAGRLEPPDPSVVVHWRRASTATASMVASVAEAIDDYARCASLEHRAAAVDSALHLGMLAPTHPAAAALRPLGIVGVCESGAETVFWLRMRHHRLPVTRQVRIPTVGRVDFLIGKRLVIEVDGREFHDRESTFERDRERDAHLSVLGHRVLRFSYRQVFERWHVVEAAVRGGVTAAGRPRPRRR